MIKKVIFVLTLFLLVDRVMYYKLGQVFHKEQQGFSAAYMASFGEERERLKKRRMRGRLAFYRDYLFNKVT